MEQLVTIKRGVLEVIEDGNGTASRKSGTCTQYVERNNSHHKDRV